jgi:hypothetical protein
VSTRPLSRHDSSLAQRIRATGTDTLSSDPDSLLPRLAGEPPCLDNIIIPGRLSCKDPVPGVGSGWIGQGAK